MKTLFVLFASISLDCSSQLITEYVKYLGKPTVTISENFKKSNESFQRDTASNLSFFTQPVKNEIYFKRSFGFRVNDPYHCVIIALYLPLDTLKSMVSHFNTFFKKEKDFQWIDTNTKTHYAIEKNKKYFVIEIFK